MSEPWIITSIERLKHDEQFKTLGPAGGFITGEQAKSFFLQSRLPPAVLGVIWNLADIDGDGKMNQNEFSIACKLINLKLRGFNLPQVLPPSLIQSAIKAPSVQSATIPAVVPAPMMPAMPTAMPAMPTTMPAMPTAIPAIPGVRPAVPAAPAASLPQAIPPLMPGSAPLIGPPPVASVMPMAAPVAQAAAPVASVAPIMATGVSLAQNQIPPMPMGNLISTNAAPPMAAGVAATASVQPLSNTTEIPSVPPIPQTVSGPPKAPIQDPGVEWGVPQASKLKFTQVFNMSDRSKTGYISGAQARNILIQSALPQQALAQIWAISDVDNDGRLSCEEFVLAMFLCEQAKAGKGVPTVLPPDLIPPTLRRSRTSSIHSQTSAGTGTVTPAEAVLSPTSAQLALDTSFEDKRRENYEKGQAELERRRKNLLDAQRREAEERMRREREEEMKREKARQEAERKRQEELEREMHRQREIEAQKEAERKRMEETKEQARKDAERQRQEEWEKQRLLELMNVRQRQQENLLALKAKNQSLTIEISTKEDKIKELTQKISETRTGVTEVKATIDNMRNTRDTYMGDMNALKAQARDQNQRLLNLNQEKARLKARSLASAAASGAETAAVEASVTSKQMVIKQLQEKVQELENEFTAKEEDVNNNLTEFQSTKEQFLLTGERCKDLYEEYCSKRIEVLALRDKLLNPDAAWGDTGGTSWSETPNIPAAAPAGGERKFKALYQFDARNEDELSFAPGDIIVVIPSEGLEPGWQSGNLNNKVGWFPEAYCEPYEGDVPEVIDVAPIEAVAAVGPTEANPCLSGDGVAGYTWKATKKNQLSVTKGDKIVLRERLEGWVFGDLKGVTGWLPGNYVRGVTSPLTSPQELPEATEIPQQLDHDVISEYYVAVYPYQSEEAGDLVFETGETILVVHKEGDWWFGVVGTERSGIFPSNYVQIASIQGKGKKLEVAQVIAPYDATSANQLSLVRGQLVSIRKKTASGWWEGELHAKGKKRQLGWFPASYVKVLCGSSRTTPVSMEMTGRDEYPPADFTPGAFANAFSKDVIKVDPKPKPPPPQDPETVEALYPYTAVNDDELTFSPGDLIFVLDKEDSAWWKGSLKGVIGVFPSNYVQPKSEARVVTKHDPVVVSPDADDSLCYFEDTTTASSNSWMRQSASSLRNQERSKRLTIYQCFDSPEEGMRQNVINEFIATESSYLDSLLLVQKAFIEPMKKSGVITVKEIELIFMNWSELVLVSSSFNKALKVRWRNTNDGNIHMISDILCQQIRQLQPYMRFCSLQSKGSALLNKKFEEDTAWANVIKECQERPDVAGHTLTSFLLKPLQRLTKYPLLIKKLLSFTPSEHPDYQNTVDALQAANTLCEQVNEAARQQDNTDKLEWMQSHILCDNLMERLVFNSLTNILGPRKLLHMGQLHKTKSKREIVAFLLSDFLLLTTPNKSIKSPSSLMNFERALADTTCTMYKKPLFLSDISVQLEPDSLAGFLITTSGMSIALVATSVNDRTNWLKRITLAQKHISDTERSLFHRNQSKEKDSGIVGRVLLSVMGGVDLVVPNEGVLHSFCEVSLGSQVQRTMVGTSAHPKWDSAMQFLIKSLSEDVLCITVYEKGFFRPNEFLGRAEVRIQSIFEASGDRPEPHVMRLRLQEVSKGEVILKSSLQLFK